MKIIYDLRSNEHYKSGSENKAWKKKMQACAGFESHDICGTGAMLYQLSLQVNWGLVIMLVRNKPVR